LSEEIKPGCARPTGGLVGEKPEETTTEQTAMKKEVRSMVMIGRKAQDFMAPGYFQGKFINVHLSDYLGKWVLLCFYPGDFTFV